MKPRKNSK